MDIGIIQKKSAEYLIKVLDGRIEELEKCLDMIKRKKQIKAALIDCMNLKKKYKDMLDNFEEMSNTRL